MEQLQQVQTLRVGPSFPSSVPPQTIRQHSHTYEIDNETGFYIDTMADGVTVTQKKALLEFMEENPHGNGVVQACEKAGLSASSFYRHVSIDPAFRAAWEKLKERYGYRVEAVNASLALEPKYVIDRMAYLRAFRRERYAPEMTVNVNVPGADYADLRLAAGKVIDTIQLPIQELNPPSIEHSSTEQCTTEKQGRGAAGEGSGPEQKETPTPTPVEVSQPHSPTATKQKGPQ